MDQENRPTDDPFATFAKLVGATIGRMWLEERRRLEPGPADAKPAPKAAGQLSGEQTPKQMRRRRR